MQVNEVTMFLVTEAIADIRCFLASIESKLENLNPKERLNGERER